MRKREPLTLKEAETIRVLLTLTPVRKEDGELSVLAADLLEKLVDHVVWYHEAKDAERARIVAWLKERSDTAYAAGNEPRGDALLNASRVLETIKVTP